MGAASQKLESWRLVRNLDTPLLQQGQAKINEKRNFPEILCAGRRQLLRDVESVRAPLSGCVVHSQSMGNFAYVARNADGERVSGTLSGTNENSVLAELQARRLAPVRVTAVRGSPRWSRRISTRQMATAYRQLADLLRAGVPLLRAIRLLGRSRANPQIAAVMSDIADAVADGSRLASAMSAHDEVFSSVHLAMVRAGERGGFLEEVLNRLARFLDHQADMRAKVIGNLIYPLMLLLLSGLVIVGFLVFFVPKFEPLFARMQLPLPTRMVLGASTLLTSYWPLLLVALVVALVGGRWMLRREAVRRTLAAWQLRVPKVGPLIRYLAVARFARMLGTLLGNGVPLLSAMQIARGAAGNLLLEEAIDNATEAVRSGEPLAGPLAESGFFGEDVVEMIAVGEAANNLPEVLITSVADTIESRIDRMLTLFVRLLEPALLLVVAGVVMFLYIALIVPMMRMSSAIGG